MRIAFAKVHGAGNDFALVDARAQALDEQALEEDAWSGAWAGVARALADRAGPVGGDGLLLLTDGDPGGGGECAFGFRMLNPDGSEAETCLNGVRCVARAGFEALGIDRAHMRLRSSVVAVAKAGAVASGVYGVEERAGPAGLDVRDWPMDARMADRGGRVVDAVIPALSPVLRFTAVAMPNPHLIAFVDSAGRAVDEAELVRVGSLCEAAPAWLPERANVSFCLVGDGGLFVRTHERGAGLTQACGSAVASATVAAALTGRIAFDREVAVRTPGGPMRARVDAGLVVTLTGNATVEWEGSVEVDPGTGRARDLTVARRFPDEVAAWGRVA